MYPQYCVQWNWRVTRNRSTGRILKLLLSASVHEQELEANAKSRKFHWKFGNGRGFLLPERNRRGGKIGNFNVVFSMIHFFFQTKHELSLSQVLVETLYFLPSSNVKYCNGPWSLAKAVQEPFCAKFNEMLFDSLDFGWSFTSLNKLPNAWLTGWLCLHGH